MTDWTLNAPLCYLLVFLEIQKWLQPAISGVQKKQFKTDKIWK